MSHRGLCGAAIILLNFNSESKSMSKDIEETPETPPQEKQQKMNMDTLVSVEELPQVQEHAIAAVTAEKEKKKYPDGFDPEIHAVDDQGNPKKTKAGKFAKKRGRKSTLNTGKKSKKEIEAEAEAEKMAETNHQSAVVVSGILEQAQIKMISDDFIYSEQERESNIAVWEQTFEYYGGVNIPPPVALAMDHMTIILSRAQKPQVKDKFTLIKAWFKTKFKRKPKNARINSGENPERENDVREKESA